MYPSMFPPESLNCPEFKILFSHHRFLYYYLLLSIDRIKEFNLPVRLIVRELTSGRKLAESRGGASE